MTDAIVLFSSARRNGNTGTLTDRVAKELDLEVIDLGEKNISPFDYKHRNRGDDFEPLMERAVRSQHIVFASPIYWYSVPPSMKAFIDRISDYLDVPDLLEKGRVLRGKTGYVICTSVKDAPDEVFLDMFRQVFAYFGMAFGGYLHEKSPRCSSNNEAIQNFIRLLSP